MASPAMMATTSLDGAAGAGRDAPAWMWAPPIPPSGGVPASSVPYWDMHPTAMPMERGTNAPSAAACYMMYRPDNDAGMLVPPPPMMAQAPSHPAMMYPFPMPMSNEAAGMGRMSGPPASSGAAPGSGYMMPMGSGYPMMDASVPMMMPMAPAMPMYPMHPHERSPDVEVRTEPALVDAWASLPGDASAPENSDTRLPNMTDLLALSRQAQLEADGGPNANVFVCPHCEKRYVGKHARSIWRRHLQDKHAIPLSVQPRRTRWDRDANRPRNAAERRERMLESKRRWARKKREQERRAMAAERAAASASKASPAGSGANVSVADESVSSTSSTSLGAHAAPVPVAPEPMRLPTPPPKPTPLRALAPRDTNVPTPRMNLTMKSPMVLDAKMYMATPFQSTPRRSGFTPSAQALPSPSDSRAMPGSARRHAGLAPPSSLTKRSMSDRAALASFARVDAAPRMAAPQALRQHEGPMSPPSRAGKSGRQDQFSSPQNLNLTQSLGLAPHSISKAHGGFHSLYGSHHMTPMGAAGTPLSRMPLGLTPTINGLLRGSHAGDLSAQAVLGAGGDLGSYSLGFTPLESPRALNSLRRTPRHISTSFHSSSERDEDEDLDQDSENRIISPSLRQRVRGKRGSSPQNTPSKVMPPLWSTVTTPLGARKTPRSSALLR